MTLVSRAASVPFLAALTLLPWGALLPLGRLHTNAQWPDLLFAVAILAWLIHRLERGALGGWRPAHAALAAYLIWAAASLALANPRPASGPAKLLGLGLLGGLFVVASELRHRPGMAAAMARVVGISSLGVAASACAGFGLALAGVLTPFVGGPGDLLPGSLPRAQAGFGHPNLLASYCVFASAVAARRDAALGPRLRRLVQVSLAVTVVLTASRAILAFLLSALVRRATTPARRRLALCAGVLLATTMLALSMLNLRLDTARPWNSRIEPGPSPRLAAALGAFATLADRPLAGTGPGGVAGSHDRVPMDAHLTPLNVAATLGLPALAALVLLVSLLWRGRARPTDLATWGLLAGLALDGLGQDVEDFRHVWIALGLADDGDGRRRAVGGERTAAD